jgi:hypothetical protein
VLNKVVARFAEGPVVKGMTADFFPGKDVFHLSLADAPPDAEPIEVRMQDLKALFFVKDYQGDPAHVEQKGFDEGRPPAGRRIQVTFKDGETLVGTTTGYQPGRPGFFLVPADPESNIERCYVVSAATESVGFI